MYVPNFMYVRALHLINAVSSFVMTEVKNASGVLELNVLRPSVLPTVLEAAVVLRDKLMDMKMERQRNVSNVRRLIRGGKYAAPEQHAGWNAIIRESDDIRKNLDLVEEIIRTGHIDKKAMESLLAFKLSLDRDSLGMRTSPMIVDLLIAFALQSCN